MQIEIIILILSLLFFVSILSGKASSKFGVPALLLFLGVGMLFGEDGLGVEFNDYGLCQTVGTVTLCIILFSGGMSTKVREIQPVIAQGVILSTLGVLITALMTGFLIYYIFRWISPDSHLAILPAMLLASIMSSTDSASVFSILRSRNLRLRDHLRPLLELESGSNDPMAYMLVITLMGMLSEPSDVNYYMILARVATQLIMGAAAGLILGYLAVKMINRLRIDNESLYPILVLTFCLFTFSVTYFLQGNGYLAVYVCGLFIGHSRFAHKRTSMNFLNGMAWLLQLAMFLMLGLLVRPRELWTVAVPGILVSLVMIFLTRPVAVLCSLLPFRMSPRHIALVSWVGLRGAVPIIFAIMPLASGLPASRLMFNVVFFCTLVSLLVQGSSLPWAARRLGLSVPGGAPSRLRDFDIEMSEEIDALLREVTMGQDTPTVGKRLMELRMPSNTLVTMIKRQERYFVPTGSTELMEGDVLLVMTDREESFDTVCEMLGIKP